MTIDLDQIAKGGLGQMIGSIDAWDFSVTFNGWLYHTERPSVADVMLLDNLKTLGATKSAELLCRLIGAEDVDPAELMEVIGRDRIVAFLGAYMAYFRSKLPKNSTAIADLARSAVASDLAKESATG